MLTEKKIQSLKPQKIAKRYIDSNGLYLIVKPTGYMAWQFRYHIYEGGKRHEKIATIQGGYPTVSLKQARGEHRLLRDRVLKGEDVQDTKNRLRMKPQTTSESLQDISEQWLEVRKTQVKDTTWKKEWSRLDTHMLSKFATKKLDEITTQDIFKQAQAIAKTISIDTAKRTVNIVGYVYKFAITLGKTNTNIAKDLTGLLGIQKVQNRKAILDTDLLGKWVYTVENNPSSRDEIGCYIRMIAHLGVRPGELLQMKWSDISFKKQEWNYISSKKDMPFRVYLTDQIITILHDIKLLTGDKENVFYSTGKLGHFTSRAVQYRMHDLGFTKHMVVPHGFRSTMESLGIDECDVKFEVVDLCLAHKPSGSLSDVYNKATRWKDRVQFYKDWSDKLQKLKKQYQKSMIVSVK
tara:strand:- start:88 stop:1308 length:1221 start_codon:yes stop_codon:yes gene_type:complete